MSDRYETAVKRWAAEKLGIDPGAIERVEINTSAGWGGTEHTGGDPAEATVTAVGVDGRRYEVINLLHPNPSVRMYDGGTWDFVQLLTEILGVDEEAR